MALVVTGEMTGVTKIKPMVPRARNTPKNRRKHSVEQIRAGDSGKYAMTLSFVGELLSAVFVNSVKSESSYI